MSVIHLVFKVKVLHFRKKKETKKKEAEEEEGRKKKEASIPVCKPPPPTLSLPRRKGFVCMVRTLKMSS